MGLSLNLILFFGIDSVSTERGTSKISLDESKRFQAKR